LALRGPTPDQITGVILAGGRGSRLGGCDKGLITVGGRPLVGRVIDRLQPQVRTLLISANRNLDQYRRYGFPVIRDRIGGFAGPLAGVSSALAAARTPWVAVVPCDNPDPPPDLVDRLCRVLLEQGGDMAVASDGRRMQPVYALIPRAVASSLEAWLESGERKTKRWYGLYRTAIAAFDAGLQPFANINTADDLDRLCSR
jgi:molybdopterin-guanine dinucleotide biosynthesis protein A